MTKAEEEMEGKTKSDFDHQESNAVTWAVQSIARIQRSISPSAAVRAKYQNLAGMNGGGNPVLLALIQISY